MKKDLFKWIIDRIERYGYAAAIDLRNEFHTQASSFVTLIFREIPLFEVTYNPRTITFARSSQLVDNVNNVNMERVFGNVNKN